MASVRLMTFNIRREGHEDDHGDKWGNRKMAVARYLKQSGADVIGLQEVHPKQFNFLAKELSPKYGVCKSNRNPIFFLKKFTKAKAHVMWFAHKPGKPRERIPGKTSRHANCVKLEHDGRAFYVFNTHLDHISDETRRKQGKILASHAEEFSGDKSIPRVIFGDFNSGPNKGGVKALVNAGYTTFSAKHNQGTFVGFNGKKSSRLDWFFVKNASLKDYEVRKHKYWGTGSKKRNLSDHLPVLSTLPLGGGGKIGKKGNEKKKKHSNVPIGKVTIKNAQWNEWLYSDKSIFEGKQKQVFTWSVKDAIAKENAHWKIEEAPDGKFVIRTATTGEPFFASALFYDNDQKRRRISTWSTANAVAKPTNAHWNIEEDTDGTYIIRFANQPLYAAEFPDKSDGRKREIFTWCGPEVESTWSKMKWKIAKV